VKSQEGPPANCFEADLPSSIEIKAGQIWVGDLLIHEQTKTAVQYQLVDSNGRPYGTPLSISRLSFAKRFVEEQGRFLLRLQIQEVARGSVLYQQLDAETQPIDEPKRVSIVIFARSFRPAVQQKVGHS